MEAGDWLETDKVKCVLEVDGVEFPSVIMFVVDDTGITKLGVDDLEVACMREILKAVSMEGSFSFPDTQEDHLVVQPEPSRLASQGLRSINIME